MTSSARSSGWIDAPTPAGDPQAIVDAVVDLIEQLAAGEDGRRGRRRRRRLHRRRRSRPSTTRRTSTGATSRCAPSCASGFPASTSPSTTTRTPRAGPSSASAPVAACSDMTMLTIGTGVGGAIVADDRLLPRRLRCRRRDRPPARRARRPALRLRAARLHRAVRLGSRAAAHGERDRGCRRHRPDARRGASRSTASSTAPSSRDSSTPTTRVRSPPCASSAAGSARPVPRSAPCSTRGVRLRRGSGRPPASCCSTRSARRTSPTCRRAASTRSREFTTAELVNDAGVVGAADLARLHGLLNPGVE